MRCPFPPPRNPSCRPPLSSHFIFVPLHPLPHLSLLGIYPARGGEEGMGMGMVIRRVEVEASEKGGRERKRRRKERSRRPLSLSLSPPLHTGGGGRDFSVSSFFSPSVVLWPVSSFFLSFFLPSLPPSPSPFSSSRKEGGGVGKKKNEEEIYAASSTAAALASATAAPSSELSTAGTRSTLLLLLLLPRSPSR